MFGYINICYKIEDELRSSIPYPYRSSFTPNITLYVEDLNNLFQYCKETFNTHADTEKDNFQSQPMMWIGIYIAVASLVCTLAMAADLLHGLRNKKFWFPCKFFTLNAASITVIAAAMKLPVDLTSAMPGEMDQAAKLGSLAFMCTIMVNLMPSLASMDGKTLLANVI
nr:pentatricopeptide repeat-containing protein [Tanacetum cinerariifolium]